MRKLIIAIIILFPALSMAHTHAKTTEVAMACYIIAPDEKWTFKDYGFTLAYKDADGKRKKITAESSGTKKNCTDKTVVASAKIPVGPVKIHINDFTGEAGSTVECTNTIKHKFTKKEIGKHCEFIVKSVKYGAYTSNDECAIEMTCS